MRPGPPPQAPSENHADRARDQPRAEPRRALRCVADRVLAEDAPDRSSEQVIGLLRLALEGARDDPHERDRWARRIAYWRPAAAGIPSMEALGTETQAGDALLALNERERGRRDLDDVGASLSIEK